MINLDLTGNTPVSSDSQTPTRKRKGVWHFFKRVFIGYCKKHDRYHQPEVYDRYDTSGRGCISCKLEWDEFVRDLHEKNRIKQEEIFAKIRRDAIKQAKEGDLTEVTLRRKVTINNE